MHCSDNQMGARARRSSAMAASASPLLLPLLLLCADCGVRMASANMMAQSVVVKNNLGGLGPWPGLEPIIEYNMLVDLLFPDVHLRVRNITEYTPSLNPGGGVLFNGLSGVFGNINVRSATSVRLSFEFFNTTDGMPFFVPEFIFTWLDLDGGQNNMRMEIVRTTALQLLL